MREATPRELVQASLVCLVLAASVLHFSPEFAGYLQMLANALAASAVMPTKPRAKASRRKTVPLGASVGAEGRVASEPVFAPINAATLAVLNKVGDEMAAKFLASSAMRELVDSMTARVAGAWSAPGVVAAINAQTTKALDEYSKIGFAKVERALEAYRAVSLSYLTSVPKGPTAS